MNPSIFMVNARFALAVLFMATLALVALAGCRAPSVGDALEPTQAAAGQRQLAATPLPANRLPATPLPATPVPVTPASIPTEAPAAAPALSTPRQEPALTGREAPDFPLTLYQGQDILGAEDIMLSDLRGTPLVINFWARLCQPCWSEMPELQEFYEEFHPRVELVGVDIGKFTGLGSGPDAGKLLQSLGIAYPAGVTEDGSVVRKYGVRAMPTTVFITAEGKVFRKWSGRIDLQTAINITQEMLRTGR